jgi:predicted house-cleaning NTP pyrophosphatase (Maf/HAM1 superfamily)
MIYLVDKAGAYALQSGEGSVAQEIRGSRTNVVGLPMEKLKMRLDMLR